MDLIVYEYLLLLGATVIMMLSLFFAMQNRDDGFSWFFMVFEGYRGFAVWVAPPVGRAPPCKGWHSTRISFNG